MFGEIAGGRVHVGVHRTGLHIVDGDAARAEIAGQPFDQPHQRGLAHGIDAAADKGHSLGVAAADGDDASARLSCA